MQKTHLEKIALIHEWTASGESIGKWAKQKNIPASTFAGWVRAKKQHNKLASIQREDFMFLEKYTKPMEITVEYLGVKIQLSCFDAKSLEACLIAVKRSVC